MSTIQNLHPNPLNGGAVTGGMALGSTALSSGGATGTRSVVDGWQRITVSSMAASSTFGVSRAIPLTGLTTGSTLRMSARLDGALPAGMGAYIYADLLSSTYAWLGYAVGVFENGVAQASVVLPEGATILSWQVYVQPSSAWTGSLTVGFGHFNVRVSETALDPMVVFHGDSPGWGWTGSRFASASFGPSEPFAADGSLSVGGSHLEYIDAIADFTNEAESASTVQTTLNITGTRHHVSVRPAGPSTGTLTLHFTREIGSGDPGVRAERVANSFRTGKPHILIHDADISGLAPFEFVPTGIIERRLEVETVHRKRQSVWTVTVDYTRTDGA